MKSKTFRNVAEQKCCQSARGAGWLVTKRGWPDFFMLRKGQIALVEVKPHKGHGLKASQVLIMKHLSSFGIPCFLWSPDAGFQRVSAESLSKGLIRIGKPRLKLVKPLKTCAL